MVGSLVVAFWAAAVVSVRGMEDHFVGRFSNGANGVCVSPNHVGLVNRRASCGNKFMFPNTMSGNVVTRVHPGKARAIVLCSVSLGSHMRFGMGSPRNPHTS